MLDNQKTKPPALADAGGKTTTNLKPLKATASLVDAQNLSKQAAQNLSKSAFLTLIRNKGSSPLTKSFSLSPDGSLQSSTAAQLTNGGYKRIGVNSLVELGALLDSLKPHECVTFGTTEFGRGDVLSKAEYSKLANPSSESITRTTDYFSFPSGRAIMVLDFDKRPGVEMQTANSLIETIRSAIPELEYVDLLIGASTSSNIVCASTGKELKGVSGFHVQFFVDNGVDIPEIGKWIEAKLWLAGHGWMLVTENGALLEKTLVDKSVWQPSKLIFNAASCGDGLVQKKAPRAISDALIGRDLSLSDLPPLTAEELTIISKNKNEAHALVNDEAIRKKADWVARRVDDYKERNPQATNDEIEAAKHSFKNANAGVLPLELVLHFNGNITATVQEVLNSPNNYHGKELRDPFEPHYHDGALVALAVLKETARPYIYSLAHHGQNYYFENEAHWMQKIADEFPLLEMPAPPKPIGAQSGLRFEVVKPSKLTKYTNQNALIKGVLPFAEVGMLFGQSASGKSFLAIDMAASIARGVKFRDRQVQRGNVLYVVCEGAGGFGKRLAAYEQHHQCSLDDVGFHVICDAPNLIDKSDLNMIVDRTKNKNIWLIVIDTLAQASPGANENSGEDMSKILSSCRRIHQQTGAMVLLVHHSGKVQSQGERGWSGLRAGMDCSIEVTRSDKHRFFKISKLKDGEDGQTFAFNQTIVELGFDDDGDPITSCVVEHNLDPSIQLVENKPRGKMQSLIYKTLEDLEALTPDELITKAAVIDCVFGKSGKGTRKTNITRSLDVMISKGVLFCSGDQISTAPIG